MVSGSIRGLLGIFQELLRGVCNGAVFFTQFQIKITEFGAFVGRFLEISEYQLGLDIVPRVIQHAR